MYEIWYLVVARIKGVINRQGSRQANTFIKRWNSLWLKGLYWNLVVGIVCKQRREIEGPAIDG